MKKLGGFVMKFEEKRFCRISTLAARWDCSTRRIYTLIEKGVLRPFHPEGRIGSKGMMVEVKSVIEIETRQLAEEE